MGHRTAPTIDQLVVVTIARSQARELTDYLTQQGYYITQIDSQGGLWNEATTSLLIGLNHRHLSSLLAHLREQCASQRRFIPAHIAPPLLELQPPIIEVEVGGATIYVLNVEQFEQI